MTCATPAPSSADMRRCANCSDAIGVVAGKLRHVPADKAASERLYAEKEFRAHSVPTGLRVTVMEKQEEK